eukprot:scaffold6673_cov132-Isochrysis_galbana.AAC.1
MIPAVVLAAPVGSQRAPHPSSSGHPYYGSPPAVEHRVGSLSDLHPGRSLHMPESPSATLTVVQLCDPSVACGMACWKCRTDPASDHHLRRHHASRAIVGGRPWGLKYMGTGDF